jgi:hypothetical protein
MAFFLPQDADALDDRLELILRSAWMCLPWVCPL